MIKRSAQQWIARMIANLLNTYRIAKNQEKIRQLTRYYELMVSEQDST